MDKQTIFNKAYNGIMSQTGFAVESINDTEVCYYAKCDSELMCALGHCAESKEQALTWESEDLSGESVSEILGIPEVFGQSLQIIHDDAAYANSIDKFKRDMQEFAKKENLSLPKQK